MSYTPVIKSFDGFINEHNNTVDFPNVFHDTVKMEVDGASAVADIEWYVIFDSVKSGINGVTLGANRLTIAVKKTSARHDVPVDNIEVTHDGNTLQMFVREVVYDKEKNSAVVHVGAGESQELPY